MALNSVAKLTDSKDIEEEWGTPVIKAYDNYREEQKRKGREQKYQSRFGASNKETSTHMPLEEINRRVQEKKEHRISLSEEEKD